MALSEASDSPFDGPGGRRECSFKEKIGVKRLVIVAYFCEQGIEMPEWRCWSVSLLRRRGSSSVLAAPQGECLRLARFGGGA